MKPNNNTSSGKPVEVIDTEGVTIDETAQPNKDAANPEQNWIGPERAKLEQELQQLDARWKSTQFIKLMTKLGKELVMMDPEVKANLTEDELTLPFWSAYRATGNLIIGGLDIIPIIGDSVSGGADGSKIAKSLYLAIKHRTKKIRARFPKWLDLTPDVPLSVAVASEAIEPFTAGWAPTHLFVEFPWQSYADALKLIELLKKIARIKAYLKDYREAAVVHHSQRPQPANDTQPDSETEEAKIIKELEELFDLPATNETKESNKQ